MFKLSSVATLLLLSLSLLGPAFAEPTKVDTVSQATAAAVDKCRNGCVILSPEDVVQLEQNVQLFGQAAFNAGAEQALAMVEANLGPICKQFEKNSI